MSSINSSDGFSSLFDDDSDDYALQPSSPEIADVDSMECESESESQDVDELDAKSEAIKNLEGLVLSFLTQLSTQPPGSSSKSKPNKIEIKLADRRKSSASETSSVATRSIKFPQRTKGPSSRPLGKHLIREVGSSDHLILAQLFRVANLMHEALVEDTHTTKRDMYYKHVPLFKTQATVDRLVDDLAATFELGRADFNVRASQKGLICGSAIRMHLKDGTTVQPSDSEGSMIMPTEIIKTFDVDADLAWVLIVEKEAVFQTLCQLHFSNHPDVPGRGVIITGKGYPDMATRALTKSLADNLPLSIPILGLVDGDPSGLHILSIYIHGSKSLRHENDRLAAGERIEWLGLRLSELTSLGVDKELLLPITKYDERKARSMLSQSEPHLPAQWRRELMHMLHIRRKAEIEILSSTNSNSSIIEDAMACRSGNILYHYLVSRISQAVGSHKGYEKCDEDEGSAI